MYCGHAAAGWGVSCMRSQSHLDLILEVMQTEWYSLHFCCFKGLDFRRPVIHPPSSFCTFSLFQLQSHVLHPEKKLPDHFPHRQFTCRQLRMSGSKPLTNILWLCVCVCACVHVYTLSSVWTAARAAQATVRYLSAGLNVTCDRGIF